MNANARKLPEIPSHKGSLMVCHHPFVVIRRNCQYQRLALNIAQVLYQSGPLSIFILTITTKPKNIRLLDDVTNICHYDYANTILNACIRAS